MNRRSLRRALGPVFEPLKDETLFAQVSVHPELDTVTWPNGADLAPEFLYRAAQQQIADGSRLSV